VKRFLMILMLILGLFAFAACDQGDQGGEGGSSGSAENVVALRIVDGAETGELVLAGEDAGDVYALLVGEIPVYLDGEPADADVLQDGMMAEIGFSGLVQETYPAVLADVERIDVYTLGTEKNPAGGTYDLCGLYLQVLEDLWAVDDGLNGGIKYINVELSEAPGNLTAGEKAAIAWIFAGNHQAQPLTLTYEELSEHGYLSPYGEAEEGYPQAYWWEDGLSFSITETAESELQQYSLPVVKFDAMKWRSPLGAYFFADCSAVWPQLGTWEFYDIGSEMIS